jgi:hypothetical protein
MYRDFPTLLSSLSCYPVGLALLLQIDGEDESFDSDRSPYKRVYQPISALVRSRTAFDGRPLRFAAPTLQCADQ